MSQNNLSIEERLERIEEILGADKLEAAQSQQKTKLRVLEDGGDASRANVMILEVEGSPESIESVRDLLNSKDVPNKSCKITELKFMGKSYTRCI